MVLAAMPAAAQNEPEAADTGPRFDINAYDLRGNTLLSAETVNQAVAPYTGTQKSFADVQQALEAIEAAYVDAGYTAVQVILPEQELEKGTVRLDAIEAKVAKVVVEGSKFFDPVNIRNSVRSAREGEAPNVKAIGRSLKVANENPSKATSIVFKAGEKDGDVDVVLRVQDQSPTRFILSVDNTGNHNTGRLRTGVGFQHANLWDQDHVLVAQYVTSPFQIDDVTILGAGYHIPLYDLGDSLDFTLGYSNVDSGVVTAQGGALFEVAGSGNVFAARYNHNFDRIDSLDHRLSLGLDLRNYGVTARPAGTLGQTLLPETTVRPLSATYSGTVRTPDSGASFFVSAVQNIAGGSDVNDLNYSGFVNPTDALNDPTIRVDANYFLLRFGASYYRVLGGDWQVRLAFNAQQTKEKLVSGEKFGVGGMDSLRGFQERELTSDVGRRASVEVYTPDFGPQLGEGLRLRGLVFLDHAQLRRNHPNLATDIASESAGSLGAGLRLQSGENMSIRFDFAYVSDGTDHINPVIRNEGQGKNDMRLHGSFLYLF